MASGLLNNALLASVPQEATHFRIVSPLVAQDLTEAQERFCWESFKSWLGANGDQHLMLSATGGNHCRGWL